MLAENRFGIEKKFYRSASLPAETLLRRIINFCKSVPVSFSM